MNGRQTFVKIKLEERMRWENVFKFFSLSPKIYDDLYIIQTYLIILNTGFFV